MVICFHLLKSKYIGEKLLDQRVDVCLILCENVFKLVVRALDMVASVFCVLMTFCLLVLANSKC